MPINHAAWLNASKARPLEVRDAPYTSPGANEIVVRNCAVAINPVDWMIQDLGTSLMYRWLKYPCILGTDVAGEVIEVGERVTRFSIGDRVLGYAAGNDEKRINPAESAFQTYTVILAHMAAPIPNFMSYEDASVLPLGVATAACGLFQRDQLALQLPSINPGPTGKTLLIWGGSTSVGSNAIQLAVAAGYEVFTTASPRNFDYVKKLGASKVFDYNSKTAIPELIKAFEGKVTAGALSIGSGAAEACFDVLNKCQGNKFVSMATYPMSPHPPQHFAVPVTAFNFASWNISTTLKSKIRSIG